MWSKKAKKHVYVICECSLTLGGLSATILLIQSPQFISSIWKVRTTIVSATYQIPRALRIVIAISFTDATLIRAGATTPSTVLTSRAYDYNTVQQAKPGAVNWVMSATILLMQFPLFIGSI